MQTLSHLSVLIHEQAKKYGSKPALTYREFGSLKWQSVTWNYFSQQVKFVSNALLNLGVKPQENEDVVRSFLDANAGFRLESAGAYLPLKPSSHDMVQFYPQRDGIDGFFIARLRRGKG